MKKISTRTAQAFRKIQKLTIGLDLGDRSSWYCVLDESGTVPVTAYNAWPDSCPQDRTRGRLTGSSTG